MLLDAGDGMQPWESSEPCHQEQSLSVEEPEDTQVPLRADVRGLEAAAHLVTSSGPYGEPRAEPGSEPRSTALPSKCSNRGRLPLLRASLQTKGHPREPRFLLS